MSWSLAIGKPRQRERVQSVIVSACGHSFVICSKLDNVVRRQKLPVPRETVPFFALGEG